MLGGEGNGGVIDPRVGSPRDSFVAMALVLDWLAETGEPLSRLVEGLPKYAMVKDQYPLAPGQGRLLTGSSCSGIRSRPLTPKRKLTDVTAFAPRLVGSLGSCPSQQYGTDRSGDR